MTDSLNAEEQELRQILAKVLEGPLAPIRTDLAPLKTIALSVANIAGIIRNTAEEETKKILDRLGDIDDETDGKSASLTAALVRLDEHAERQQERLGGLQTDVASRMQEAVQVLETGLSRSIAAQADRLAAAQADTAATLATVLVRLHDHAEKLAADHDQINLGLIKAVAKLEALTTRVEDGLEALHTSSTSKLQAAEQTLEASFVRALTIQIDKLTSNLTPQLAAAKWLGLFCAAGIVLVLAAGLFRGFWH